jgi:rubrerythrin
LGRGVKKTGRSPSSHLNILWDGTAADIKDTSIDPVAVRNLNKRIKNDIRVDVVLLPIVDWISLVRKREGVQEVIIVSTSEENLREAFIRKAQQVQKYKLFAHHAGRENAPQVERLFRAAAEAASVRAFHELLALHPRGHTEEDLKEAISEETEELEQFYPSMLKQAKEDHHRSAEWAFTYAQAAEELHTKLYKAMLENFSNLKDQEYPYFVCPGCGNIIEKEAPEQCPVCGTNRSLFKTIS